MSRSRRLAAKDSLGRRPRRTCDIWWRPTEQHATGRHRLGLGRGAAALPEGSRLADAALPPCRTPGAISHVPPGDDGGDKTATSHIPPGRCRTKISAHCRIAPRGCRRTVPPMARWIQHSDESGKRLFSHRRMVADLVRLLGDPWVDDLDLDRLERLPAEHVAGGLRVRRADLPWWAPFKLGAGRPAGAGVMFHIELQSSPDARMAERLLEYVVLLRGDLRRSGWTRRRRRGCRWRWRGPRRCSRRRTTRTCGGRSWHGAAAF